MRVEYDTNKVNFTVMNLLKVIDNARYDRILNSYGSREEVDITPIDLKNIQYVVHIFMMSILSVNFMRIYYHPPINKVYPQKLNLNRQSFPSCGIKMPFLVDYFINPRFLNGRFHWFFCS